MKGTVLTKAGDPVQVVNVAESSGAQVAVITIRDKALTISWVGWPDASQASVELIRQVREAAVEALRDRDAAFLRLLANRFRATVLSASGVIPGTGEPVLSRSGRRMRFEFQHRMLETGVDRYQVTIRRLRRPDAQG